MSTDNTPTEAPVLAHRSDCPGAACGCPAMQVTGSVTVSTPTEAPAEARWLTNLIREADRIEAVAITSDVELLGTIGAVTNANDMVRSHRAMLGSLRARAAALDALSAEYRDLHTFCPECGPNVRVDEDGCCASCGATAMGPGVDDLRALLARMGGGK